MTNIRTFFACIPHFFSVMWASFISLFVSKWRVDSKPCDIEAVCNVKQNVETGNTICTSSTDEFVDIDLNAKTQPIKISEKKTQAMNFEHPTKAIKFNLPSRRPSGRMSAVDPVKSRILDTTLKNVQDRATNVVRPVVITPGTFTAVACTAQIEYYYGVINEPSSAQIEYFDDHISSAAKIEYFQAPAIKVKVKVIDIPTSESSNVSTANIGHEHDRTDENRHVDEPVLKPFTLNVEDVDAPVIESSTSWTKYTEITSKGNDYQVQFDCPLRGIPFTPLPEKKSWRVKEKRVRQRESLFDLIAQFPDIPHHTPPGPEVSVISLENIEDGPKYSRDVDNGPQSLTVSERSTSSFGCDNIISYYGSAPDDTAQTSAPGSPDLASSSFSVLGGNNTRPDVSKVWHVGPLVNSYQVDAFRKSEADLLARNPHEGFVPMSAKGALSEGVVSDPCASVSGEFRTPIFSQSGSESYVKTIAHDEAGPVNVYHSQTGFDDAEQPEDQVIIEAHRATACAILGAPQEDDSDVSMDGLLGQLEASSFDSTYKRPQSLVWFAERSFRAVAPAKATPVSELADYAQPAVTPLRIVEKSKIRPAEVVAEVIVAEPVTEVVAESAAEAVQDEVLVQECLRWEELRQAGLKSFREAVVGDDDFYNLFYRDSCRYSQSSLATDGLGLSGDFAADSARDSDSEVALNDYLLFGENIESTENSLEGMGSTLDLSNSSEVTMLEEHATASPSRNFALEDFGRVNAKLFDSSAELVDDCESPPAWVAASDVHADRVDNTGEDIRWSSLLELDAYTQ